MKRKIGFIVFLVVFGVLAFVAYSFTRGLAISARDASIDLAQQAISERRFDDARTILAQTEAKEGPALIVNLTRADSFLKQMNVEGAIEEVNKGIALEPNNLAGYLKKSNLLVLQDKAAEGLALLQEHAALGGNSFEYFLVLGTCQLAVGKNEEGVASFRKAASLQPSKKADIERILKESFSLTL